jgi:hypothetical protein
MNRSASGELGATTPLNEYPTCNSHSVTDSLRPPPPKEWQAEPFALKSTTVARMREWGFQTL